MNDIVNQPFYEPLCVLWNYLRRPSVLKKADCIVGFGNYNCDIGIRAAELYHEGYSEKVLFSGGFGRNTLGLQTIAEAERFAEAAIKHGVPEQAIFIENLSTNSSENISFTRKMLEEIGIFARRLIVVHQPFMEKRTAAGFDIYWNDVEVLTTSPHTDIPTFFEHAVLYGVTEKMVIEEIVGNFQRMDLYAEKGWQSRQEIPESAWDAFKKLVALGYDGQLAR